jgi:hypothetical protein
VSAAFQTVHVRVNDAATGQPTPVLIHFRGPDATYYAPFGRLTKFATGRGEDVGGNVIVDGWPYACIDGTCEVRLPVGVIWVVVFKGTTYRPITQEVTIGPGKMAIRLTIERWINPRQEGWYSGDTQAFFLSPHAALLEGAAQDLNVVNLLAFAVTEESRTPALPNLLAFSGQGQALERPGHLVVVNTLNQHPALGRLALLNCHRVVYPLAFGGPEGVDEWTLADWCDQCHRKGGLVVAADFFAAQRWMCGEIIADLILGKVDALDVTGPWAWEERPLADLLRAWYQLLACGLRVPLVAGSGKVSNTCSLGATRTYAKLQPGQEFTYRNWIEAVRVGRTFVTDWALLFLTVNGQCPGSIIDVPASTTGVMVRAEARGLAPFGRLEVLFNGDVVAQALPAPYPPPSLPEGQPLPANTIVVETVVPIGAGGWLAARCGHVAHTSPVYVQVEGQSAPPDPDALAFVKQHLYDMIEWVPREGRFENAQQRRRLAGVFTSALQALPPPPPV